MEQNRCGMLNINKKRQQQQKNKTLNHRKWHSSVYIVSITEWNSEQSVDGNDGTAAHTIRTRNSIHTADCSVSSRSRC